MPRVIQIPSINAWAYLGGETSERGADSDDPRYFYRFSVELSFTVSLF